MKKFLAVLATSLMLLPALAFAQTASTTTGSYGHYTRYHKGGSASSTPSSLTRFSRGNASSTAASLSTVTGTVVSVSAPTITLTVSGGTDTVDATNAKIYRKYGAVMAITDIQNGDNLSVRGTVSGTNVTATTIRDESQQQKNGSFSGSVTAVNSPAFTLQTKNRGAQTINTDSSTVFKKGGQADSDGINDIVVGENVTVSGLWDSTASTVAASTVNIVVKTGSVSGTLASINGTTLTVTAKNASSTVYTVDASAAKFIRRYGATTQISELQTGDSLTITGTINGLNITAKTVRDLSVQAYNGTFTGTITTVNGDGSFVLQSKSRGNQTINITGSTIFRIGSASTTSSGISVGQTSTVSGVWDRTASNVTANRVTVKVSSLSFAGTLTAVNGTTLTVTASTTAATVYTVDASSAKVRFEHSHSGSLSNFQVNDSVKVWGKATTGSTNVTASIVQDLSRTYNATSTPQ